MLIKKIYVDAMGPVETSGTTGDLHGRGGFAPSVLNKLANRLVKGKTEVWTVLG